ncbi:MAG: hypothetical protein WCH39_04350, partial [Schlesneria sp.]
GSRSYGLCHAVFDLQKLTNSPREESRIAIDLMIHRGFQVSAEVCCNSAAAILLLYRRSERATLV